MNENGDCIHHQPLLSRLEFLLDEGGDIEDADDDRDANFLSAPGAALPENELVRLFISVNK